MHPPLSTFTFKAQASILCLQNICLIWQINFVCTFICQVCSAVFENFLQTSTVLCVHAHTSMPSTFMLLNLSYPLGLHNRDLSSYLLHVVLFLWSSKLTSTPAPPTALTLRATHLSILTPHPLHLLF